ncbi:MAG: hypothetical protein GF408_06065 [Candidatus Omnitrophica bacterium]|nr:hypothetical protein [Candidatus Omnitrophota bacterium]
MPEHRPSGMKKRTFTAVIVLLFLLLAPILFFDRIFIGLAGRISGLDLKAESVALGPPAGITLTGLEVVPPDGGLAVIADKAEIKLDPGSSLRLNALVLICGIKHAAVKAEKAGSINAIIGSGVSKIVFGAVRSPYNISFTMVSGKKTFEIRGLEMISENINISGGYILHKEANNIELELTISLSPELYNSLPDELRSAGFSADENGRYGTIISYKGNPAFLKALYAITS